MKDIRSAVCRMMFGMLMITASLGFTSAADAQVSFPWPPDEPDVSSYSTIEQCLGASHAVEYLADLRMPRRDTIPMNARHPKGIRIPGMDSVAYLCSAKFTVHSLMSRDTLHVSEMANAYLLFLQANRKTDARELIDQWLSRISQGQDTLREKTLQLLATMAMKQVRPVPFAEVWQLFERIDRNNFWFEKIAIADNFMYFGQLVRDTLHARRAARWLVQTPHRVGAEILKSERWQRPVVGIAETIVRARRYLEREALMDSLRHSTDAFMAFLDQMRSDAVTPIREKRDTAPPIVAEFRFPTTTSKKIPERGKVSVIITTQANACGTCLGRIAMIKRFHQQFPDVQFTLLAQTRGWHGLVIEPPSPQLEAQLIDSIYRKVHQFPGSILVENTRFWKLDPPDGRRIDEPGANPFFYQNKMLPSLVYILDRNGELIFKSFWQTDWEEEYAAILEALVQQPSPGPRVAAP